MSDFRETDSLPPAGVSLFPGRPRELLVRGAVLVILAAVVGILFVRYGSWLTLSNLARQEDIFRHWYQQHPLLAYGAAFAIYVTMTGLSIPGATALTLLSAWLFGFWRALLIVSFASGVGATVSLLLSRYLFRDLVQQRFGDRLQKANQALDREGIFYLFALRLTPVVPFFVINLVMGLTTMPVLTFWWVSQVGMLPATALYVYAGDSVPNLQQLAETGLSGVLRPELFLALIALGLFPLAIKRLVGFLSPTLLARNGQAAENSGALPHPGVPPRNLPRP